MSCSVKKRTFWYVRSVETHISLYIHAIWSVLIVDMKNLCIFGKFWTECANTQADLNLRWIQCSKNTLPYLAVQIFQSFWPFSKDVQSEYHLSAKLQIGHFIARVKCLVSRKSENPFFFHKIYKICFWKQRTQ